jgi:hypothetical protein
MSKLTNETMQIIRLKVVSGAAISIKSYPQHAAEICAMVKRDASMLMMQRTAVIRSIAAERGEPA